MQRIKAILDANYGEGVVTSSDLSDYIAERQSVGLDADWQEFFGLGSQTFQQLNNEAQRIGLTVSEMIASALSNEQPAYSGEAMNITPYSGGDAAQALRDQGAEVQVTGDTTELNATIAAEDGQTLLEYVNGDASNLHMTIWSEDGQTIVTNVTGDTSALSSAIESVKSQYSGQTIRMNIVGQKMFAEGGRATQASIFGEAGPEWAIPEEHSERTADLLDAARQASGFTWPEILARYGGLNANPRNTPTTLVYSPIIYAQDAEGVEEKLAEDKARFEKWYNEKKMQDEVEVYS